jgi:hypothetical protein
MEDTKKLVLWESSRWPVTFHSLDDFLHRQNLNRGAAYAIAEICPTPRVLPLYICDQPPGPGPAAHHGLLGGGATAAACNPPGAQYKQQQKMSSVINFNTKRV